MADRSDLVKLTEHVLPGNTFVSHARARARLKYLGLRQHVALDAYVLPCSAPYGTGNTKAHDTAQHKELAMTRMVWLEAKTSSGFRNPETWLVGRACRG